MEDESVKSCDSTLEVPPNTPKNETEDVSRNELQKKLCDMYPPPKKSEEELAKLPDFIGYIHIILNEMQKTDADAAFNLRSDCVLQNLLLRLSVLTHNCTKLVKENNFKLNDNSRDLQNVLDQFWLFTKKYLTICAFIIEYYHVRTPDWNNEIKPMRMLTGVVYSHEDFLEFMNSRQELAPPTEKPELPSEKDSVSA